MEHSAREGPSVALWHCQSAQPSSLLPLFDSCIRMRDQNSGDAGSDRAQGCGLSSPASAAARLSAQTFSVHTRQGSRRVCGGQGCRRTAQSLCSWWTGRTEERVSRAALTTSCWAQVCRRRRLWPFLPVFAQHTKLRKHFDISRYAYIFAASNTGSRWCVLTTECHPRAHADVVYKRELVEPFLDTVEAASHGRTRVLVANGDRVSVRHFLAVCL